MLSLQACAPTIFSAARAGNKARVQAALDRGADINARHRGISPLHEAIGVLFRKPQHQAQADMVKFLLERGAEVNMPNGAGSTPLHWAIRNADTNPQVVKLLLDHGADPLLKNLSGDTPWDRTLEGPLVPKLARQYMEEAVKRRGIVSAVPSAPPSLPASRAKTRILPEYRTTEESEDFAVIVGIENYPDLPAATYAERDAAATKSFIRALGVPERNIVLLTGNRATKSGLEKTIEDWLPNNVSEKSRVYFYYSGHGAPDPKSGSAYLLPSDGDPQYLARTGYPLKRLYAKLGELKAKSVLVALDSCFSGAGGRSVLAKGTRPLVGKVDMAVPGGGMVSVISASAGDQISGAHDEAGYGLFTYNFLQGLNGAAKDAQGRVTLQSLYGYLKPRVQDEARRGNRDQTPQLQSGGEDLILRVK